MTSRWLSVYETGLERLLGPLAPPGAADVFFPPLFPPLPLAALALLATP
jgi:hypothetical protein